MIFRVLKKSIVFVYLLITSLYRHFFQQGIFTFELPEYIVLHDNKLIYHVISKSACTSIKLELGEKYNFQGHIHKSYVWGDKHIMGEMPKLYDDYYKFSFVRNPFSRVVSCYKDKVLSSEDEINYFSKNYPLIRGNSEFSSFVKQISLIPDWLADRHFKSQYSTLSYNSIEWSFIGKVESLNEDWKFIAKKYNYNESLRKANSTSNIATPDTVPSYYKYYTLKTCNLVYNRYKKDIIEYGYYSEYQKLYNYLKNNGR